MGAGLDVDVQCGMLNVDVDVDSLPLCGARRLSRLRVSLRLELCLCSNAPKRPRLTGRHEGTPCVYCAKRQPSNPSNCPKCLVCVTHSRPTSNTQHGCSCFQRPSPSSHSHRRVLLSQLPHHTLSRRPEPTSTRGMQVPTLVSPSTPASVAWPCLDQL